MNTRSKIDAEGADGSSDIDAERVDARSSRRTDEHMAHEIGQEEKEKA